MRWDSADLERITYQSDVAFWLHLASAPLLVHPLFSALGVTEGNNDITSSIAIIFLYILIILVSLIINRRAFMVSSLIYVMVALTQLFNQYGMVDNGLAYVGIIIGCSLLLLSGFWHGARKILVIRLPKSIQQKIPAIR